MLDCLKMWRGHEEFFHYDAAFIVVGERGANEDILEKLEEVAATLPVILILPESDQDFENSALRTGAQDCLVSAELDSHTLMRFFASDNGIGMEKSHLEKVFEVFQWLHTRGKYNGTGIGLAVVRKIVERHGGKIRVESIPGEGSVFSVTLRPCRRLFPPWSAIPTPCPRGRGRRRDSRSTLSPCGRSRRKERRHPWN